MDAGGIGPPPSRCKREGLPLAYASLKFLNFVILKIFLNEISLLFLKNFNQNFKNQFLNNLL